MYYSNANFYKINQLHGEIVMHRNSFQSVYIPLILLLVSFFITSNGYCQIVDYPAHPETSFRFHHALITLDFSQNDRSVKGRVIYQLTPQTASIQELRLMALKTDVLAVTINEKESDFRMGGDTLVVILEKPLALGSRHRVEVIYHSVPDFGVHWAGETLIWSSLFPGAVSSWLPSVPHPAIELSVELNIVVPENWTAVSNGRLIQVLEHTGNSKIFQWRTDRPVAVTDIAFVAGLLSEYSPAIKNESLRLFYESETFNAESVQNLYTETANKIRSATQYLDRSLPYGSINFVVIKDHRWEHKSFGAGLNYIFLNGGDIHEQTLRAVTSQWFGSYHRALNSSDSDAILFMQAFLSGKIMPIKNRIIEMPTDTPEYSGSIWTDWSFGRWSRIKHYFDMPLTEPAARTLEISMPATVTEPSGIYGWDIYEAIAERLAGGYTTRRPDMQLVTVRDTIYYMLEFSMEFGESDLKVSFHPQKNEITEQISIPITQLINGNEVPGELNVNGMGDRVSLSMSGWLDNILIGEVADTIVISVTKPGRFWMYQLRTDTNELNRLSAAKALGLVTDEPDMQLAISDLLRNEKNPQIRSALVKSLSIHTDGRVGTHPAFLQFLGDSDHSVRLRALEALAAYRGNDQVKQEVFRIIAESNDIVLVNHAIVVYKNLVSEEEYFNLLRRLLHEDKKREFTSTILNKFIYSDQKSRIKDQLPVLLEPENSWQIRNLSFQILTELENSPSYWYSVFESYSDDSDPRFRYIVWDKFHLLDDDKKAQVLNKRMINEYDARILNRIEEFNTGN